MLTTDNIFLAHIIWWWCWKWHWHWQWPWQWQWWWWWWSMGDRAWTLVLTRLQGPVFIHQTHPTVLYSQLCICIFPQFNCIHALSSRVYSHLYSSSLRVHTATGELYSMSPLRVHRRFKHRSVTYWISYLHTNTTCILQRSIGVIEVSLSVF